MEHPDEEFDPLENCKIVNTLYTGENFGELSLEKECLRTASIITKEKTHFAILTNGDYNEVIGKYHEYLYNLKIKEL